MLSKLSVKKPFTVLVGVILVIVLGFVSFTRMSADLLPDINLPYVIVMTTYIGATPETVETVVSAPVESSMATISNIKSIQSRSSENYSIVILEFNQTANMDSVSLEMREKLDQLESYWDDSVGHPIIMKINPNMLPTMIAAVGMEGMSEAEISAFAEEKIIPSLESIEGVASVNATGLIEESLHVLIREDKIAKINERMAELIDEKFEEAYQKIEDSREEIDKGAEELEKAEKDIKKGENQINSAKKEIEKGKQELNDKKTSTINELTSAKLQVTAAKTDLEATKMQITTNVQTAKGYVDGLKQIDQGLAALDMGIGAISNTQVPEEIVNSPLGMGINALLALPGDPADPPLTPLTPLTKYDTLYYDFVEKTIWAYKNAVYSAAMIPDPDTAAATLADAETILNTVKAQLVDKNGAGAVWNDSTRAAINNIDFTSATAWADYKIVVDEYVAYLTSTRTTTQSRKDALANQTSGLIGWTVVETNLPATDPNYATRYATLDADYKTYVDTQNAVLAQVLDGIKQLDDKIVELYKGESEALIQFSNGLSQLELTEYKLDTSKTQITSGKSEITSGKEKLEDAKTQLDDAVTQIDESKEDALKGADMTGVLTIDTISGLLTAQNFSMPAGYVDSGEDSYLVRIGDKPSTVEELSKLPILKVPMTDDEIIYLEDVADVFATSNADEVYTNVNGNRGVILSLQKQTGYSTGDVSDKIADRFTELKDQYEGLDLITLMDQGIYIDLVMSSIFENVLIGGLLAVIVLIFFLRDIRPTLVIAISIPISLIAAVVAMYFSGVTLNIISLSGLALGVGMLVDNSIVVIENIYRMRKEGLEIKEAAVEGSKEVAGAIFASTLTTVSVFLPIVFTEGMTRQLFVDMGLTIAYSLLASLLIALTVVPALSLGLIKNIKASETKATDTKFFRGYKKFLAGCLKVKPLVLLLAIGLLVGSVMLELTRGTAYFPSMESTQLNVSVGIAEDATITNVTNETNQLIEGMMEIPDITDIGAMAASSSLSMLGGMSTSSGETRSATIYITTAEDRTMTSEEIAARIKEIGAGIEGITVSVETSTMDMSALGGSGISISIKGRDLDTLYSIAEEVAAKMAATEGIDKVSDVRDKADSELRITVNKEKAVLKGLTVAQVFGQIYPKLQDAKVATSLATATDDISVYVESEIDAKFTMDVLKEMTITYKDADNMDQEVPLTEIADFSEAYSMTTINRQDQSRVVTVSASLADGYNIGLVSQVVEENVDKVELPKGYSISYGGENEQIMDALGQLVLMLILAVLFIYLIMVAQFQSLLSPFIIMFTIPLAFTGGFAALYFTKSEISIVAMIGFVMLSGVIVNNGIVLVDYINQLRERGMSKKEAIIESGATRLRPVLMTALTTILALLTMAFSKKMGADMTKPLAITVIGGMIYGTLMTLVVVPCIYDIFIREKKQKNRKSKGKKAKSDNKEDETFKSEVSETIDTSVVETVNTEDTSETGPISLSEIIAFESEDAYSDDYNAYGDEEPSGVITVSSIVDMDKEEIPEEPKKEKKSKFFKSKDEKRRSANLASTNPYMVGWN